MEASMFKKLTTILAAYKIQPQHIEQRGKVYKIFTGEQVFALKETDVHKGNQMYHYYQLLYRKGFYRFIPLYPTSNGQFAVIDQHKLYYLMPWLTNENRHDGANHEKKMIRELARLHLLTSEEIKVDQDVIKEHYERTKLRWENEQNSLVQWMEQCEKKWYMSPFEWEFVQYYNDFEKAYQYALRKLTEWRKALESKKKMRTVLVHGKINPTHFIYDDKGYGYFINFENSYRGASYQDLLPFLAKKLNTYPVKSEETIDLIYTYMKHYPLHESEKLLFKSYFAHPGSIIKLLERYTTKTAINHERKWTTNIQKSYWQLKNIEYVMMRMEQMDQQQK